MDKKLRTETFTTTSSSQPQDKYLADKEAKAINRRLGDVAFKSVLPHGEGFVKHSELNALRVEIKNDIKDSLLRIENGAKSALDEHGEKHEDLVVKNIQDWLEKRLTRFKSLGVIFFVLTFVSLLVFFTRQNIINTVNSTINSRQCQPNNPIVSAGGFCIR